MQKNKFKYKWFLKDNYPQSIDESVKKNNYKVFGTFICGGGSSMGYKLAGFNHLGGVEIDKKTAEIYKKNHNPQFLFCEDLRDFNKRQDLPQELFNLDILDGSPPCTTFSTTGKGQKSQGKLKKFAEGQSLQTLDDLVFVYCDTILKLAPKVFILENVAGLIHKNNQPYCKKILNKLSEKYKIQVFLLNSDSMGLPQSRERVFFIGHKKNFDLPKLELNFNEPKIPFSKICDHSDTSTSLTLKYLEYWKNANYGESVGLFKSEKKEDPHKPTSCICASKPNHHPFYKRRLNKKELCLAGSYPLDYDFCDNDPCFYIGMSVPPLMIANIANEIKNQWLDLINA